MYKTNTTYQFSVGEYEYRTDLDIEEDNMKIFHYCFKDNERIKMPHAFYNYTPYDYVSVDEFKQFLDEV